MSPSSDEGAHDCKAVGEQERIWDKAREGGGEWTERSVTRGAGRLETASSERFLDVKQKRNLGVADRECLSGDVRFGLV